MLVNDDIVSFILLSSLRHIFEKGQTRLLNKHPCRNARGPKPQIKQTIELGIQNFFCPIMLVNDDIVSFILLRSLRHIINHLFEKGQTRLLNKHPCRYARVPKPQIKQTKELRIQKNFCPIMLVDDDIVSFILLSSLRHIINHFLSFAPHITCSVPRES